MTVAVVVFPIVLGLGMTKGLSHDEHQHIAAGALIARQGLLPYRDFPHFHTPYLPFIYALLFKASDHLLLAARLFSVSCATAIVAITGTVAYRLFRERGRNWAFVACASAVLLALMTSLFTGASGRAWNQEPALFFALLAFFAHVAAVPRQRAGWFLVSGLLLELAVGTRLTYAPLVAPFGLAVALYSPAPRWKLRPFLYFGAGLVLGLSALLWLFALAPEQTYFGNIDFARVNVLFHYSTGEPRTMTLPKKLRYLVKEIIRPNFGLVAAALLPYFAAYAGRRVAREKFRFELRFLILLLPFFLIGSFAPSPLFGQYFYPFVPVLILIGLYALASMSGAAIWFRPTLAGVAACLALSTGLGYHSYHHLSRFWSVAEWTPMKVHHRGVRIGSRLRQKRVLTLSPTAPLEGGLSIYPAFSTGPFAWRVSPYVERSKAGRLGMVTPNSLEAMLASGPPFAFVVGEEEAGDEILIKYAREHAYEPASFEEGCELWLPPAR